MRAKQKAEKLQGARDQKDEDGCMCTIKQTRELDYYQKAKEMIADALFKQKNTNDIALAIMQERYDLTEEKKRFYATQHIFQRQ